MSDKHLHVDAKNQVMQSVRIKKLEAENSKLRSKVENLEKALLIIGERAVVDFDDQTVGDVDRVVPSEQLTLYRDWLRMVLRRFYDSFNPITGKPKEGA